MKFLIKKIFVALFFAVQLVEPDELLAQRKVTPADTGRMKWGHEDFKNYFSPGMCDRAMAEMFRINQRVFKPDTATSRLLQSDSVIREVPVDVLEVTRKCASGFNLNSIETTQLPHIAKIYLALGNVAISEAAMDKAIAMAKDKVDTISYLREAFSMNLNAIPTRLDVARKYANIIETGGINDMPLKFWVKSMYMNFYYSRYIADSTSKYAAEAIALYRDMSIEDQDKTNIPHPFNLLISIANQLGNIELQSDILNTAATVMSAWKEGAGSQVVNSMSNTVDLRKTFYNKKSKPLEEGVWYNHNGIPRPQSGKISLLVMTNHNCGVNCYSQITAIRKLYRTYGNDIDISLITSTNGFAPGSGPLQPAEEGKEAAKYFNSFLKLPFPVLVDEAPTHKLSDGRIARGPGPIASMFGGFRGVNAILTDTDGRIQWMGSLSDETDRKVIMATINRALGTLAK